MKSLLHTLPQMHGGIAPVLAIFPFARSLLDHSGFGNDVTIADPDVHWRRTNGVDGIYTKGTGRLLVANSAELEAVTDFTLFWSASYSTLGQVGRRIFSKRDAGGTQADIFQEADNTLRLYDGVTVAISPALNMATLRSVALSQKSGEKAIVFTNGARFGLMSLAATITADDAGISIGNIFGGSAPNADSLQGLIWYPDVLFPDEIAALHAWSQERRSPLVRADRRYFDQGTLVAEQEVGLVGAWDLGVVTAGTIVDKS